MADTQEKKLLLIDLDGVLNQYDGKFDKTYIPPIKQGAHEFLMKLSENYELKLFTTRNKLIACKWLIMNKLDKYFSDITNIKEPCHLFIDDRCIKFDGNYNSIIKDIKNYNVWYKIN